MTYNDPRDPNDLASRPHVADPIHPAAHTTTTATARSEGGMSWFIVGALIVAAGVLAFLYFGNDGDTTANNAPAATEGSAETGRAATGGMPAESAPAPAAPAMPADAAPANAPSAPVQPNTPAQPAQ